MAAKPDELGFIPGTQMVEQNGLPKFSSQGHRTGRGVKVQCSKAVFELGVVREYVADWDTKGGGWKSKLGKQVFGNAGDACTGIKPTVSTPVGD